MTNFWKKRNLSNWYWGKNIDYYNKDRLINLLNKYSSEKDKNVKIVNFLYNLNDLMNELYFIIFKDNLKKKDKFKKIMNLTKDNKKIFNADQTESIYTNILKAKEYYEKNKIKQSGGSLTEKIKKIKPEKFFDWWFHFLYKLEMKFGLMVGIPLDLIGLLLDLAANFTKEIAKMIQPAIFIVTPFVSMIPFVGLMMAPTMAILSASVDLIAMIIDKLLLLIVTVFTFNRKQYKLFWINVTMLLPDGSSWYSWIQTLSFTLSNWANKISKNSKLVISGIDGLIAQADSIKNQDNGMNPKMLMIEDKKYDKISGGFHFKRRKRTFRVKKKKKKFKNTRKRIFKKRKKKMI